MLRRRLCLLEVALVHDEPKHALLEVATRIDEDTENQWFQVLDEVEEYPLVVVGAVLGLTGAEIPSCSMGNIGHHPRLLKTAYVLAGRDVEVNHVVSRLEAEGYFVKRLGVLGVDVLTAGLV